MSNFPSRTYADAAKANSVKSDLRKHSLPKAGSPQQARKIHQTNENNPYEPQIRSRQTDNQTVAHRVFVLSLILIALKSS